MISLGTIRHDLCFNYYNFYVFGGFACIYMCELCVCAGRGGTGSYGGQKRMVNSLELEL